MSFILLSVVLNWRCVVFDCVSVNVGSMLVKGDLRFLMFLCSFGKRFVSY